MNFDWRHKKINQYIFSIFLIIIAWLTSYYTIGFIGYRGVALIFLLVVSIAAMLFEIYAVLTAALLSAVILNFFFIPPLYTFHIGNTEDVLMFFMYLFIALINGVLNYKIRDIDRKKRVQEEKNKTIQLYNTLLNSLSHELRTPISAVIGAIDTIQDKNLKLSENNRKELYSEIEVAALRLNRQVANLLSMSRLEAGTLKPKMDWVDINELIFHVIDLDQQEDHQINFKPDDQIITIKTDGGFIETIIHNLLHNAIQHTPKGSIITVKTAYSHNNIGISISDNGKGFPPKEMNLVFDKFYKLHGTATGGTGLGLSIVKGFIEALNGTIQLRNGTNGGASFLIEIPAEISTIKHFENE